jgi:hypothetical protein
MKESADSAHSFGSAISGFADTLGLQAAHIQQSEEVNAFEIAIQGGRTTDLGAYPEV